MARKDLITQHTQRRQSFKAELAAIQQGTPFNYSDGAGAVRITHFEDFTPEKRQQLAQQKAAQLADFDRTFITAQIANDRAKLEKLSTRRREIIAKNRLDDPLASRPGLVQLAMLELEGIAGKVRNLREFERAYESSADNPGLRRAFMLKGSSLALAKWPNDPQNGGFAHRLESDLAAAFESAESLALRDELHGLHAEAVELSQAARAIGREGQTTNTLFQLDNLGTITRQAEELTWAISAAAGVDTGENGGVFMPTGQTTARYFEGTGGFFQAGEQPAEPAAVEG